MAYTAVPLVLAGGAVAAVRVWDFDGAAVVMPPPAAFTARDSAAPAYAARGAPSAAGAAEAAEAASERAAPRAVAPTPTASARPEKADETGPAKAGEPDAKRSAKPKKTGRDAEPAAAAEAGAVRGAHPGGGREGGAEPGGESGTGGPDAGEAGVLRPGDGAADAATPGLRLPDIIHELGGGPGRTEPAGSAPGADPAGGPGAEPADGEAGKTAGKDVKDIDEDDGEVLEYFRRRWGKGDAAMKKVTDIRILGGYLRVYTKLPDTAVNSKHAVTLCKRARDYLSKERGVRHPVVFVHAKTGLNGNPVLANDLGKSDRDCRLTTPRPGRGGAK